MMEELKHHGYRIGPGTLYPLLHGMERRGLLRSELKNLTGRSRRVYRITFAGRHMLRKARGNSNGVPLGNGPGGSHGVARPDSADNEEAG